MAAAVNHRLAFFCLNNSPTFFAGFITCGRPNSLPFPLSSVSTSLSYLSSPYAPLRAHAASYGHSRSSSPSVTHITPAVAAGRDTQTNSSQIDEGQVDVLEQLGIQRLGGKEKKELRAYAHGLGTKLNVQQVGKLGVSQTVVKSISDALEANEILKVKVLENCGSDMSEIITQLERGTRGQVVGKIGRTVLLYRASQRKLAAAEKLPEKIRPRRK